MAIETPMSVDAAQGLTIKARSQREIVMRRFFRHRGALGGMIMLFLVVLLATTSIGWGFIPGWWHHSPTAPGPVVDGGRPTLSILPAFLGGDGMRLGDHPFGQDTIGKDYFAATMRGVQISMIVAVLIGVAATFIGTAIGAVAGYFRGKVDGLLMRTADVVLVVPFLLLAALLGRIVGNPQGPIGGFVDSLGIGIPALAIALALAIWPGTARVVRGEVLSIREMEFVEAARAAGSRSGRIIVRHILPNALGTIIVATTLAIATGILLETALSYLGFGVQPPDTSLGRLVSDNQTALLTRPWLFWWPGVFIVAIALAVNFIGDGLRDAFDPRQTRVRE